MSRPGEPRRLDYASGREYRVARDEFRYLWDRGLVCRHCGSSDVFFVRDKGPGAARMAGALALGVAAFGPMGPLAGAVMAGGGKEQLRCRECGRSYWVKG